MKYSDVDLFAFMDSGRHVKVTTVEGNVFTGMCWAYSSVCNAVEFGVEEASLEVQDTILYQSEIASIEYID